jgi:trans-2,3-dihydro-3-hydroxyanthranilate isomerase
VSGGRDRQEDSGLAYLILDVFAEAPLQGNQLGVFTDAVGVGSERMQRLARELNFSETVFLLPPERDGDARVRIFTPEHELPFAGHPVLGSAVAVGVAQRGSAVRLETGLGLIPVDLRWQSERGAFGRMQQRVPPWSAYEHEAELLTALGIVRSGLPIEAYPNGPLHVYVELESEQAVAELRPDMRALAELEACANCFAGHGKRWKTRMFAAAYGVSEDPATGSAAGPLAVHLGRHGRIAFGEEIEIRQGVEIGRPSVLYARAEGSAERVERVEVGGSAVIVARGEFLTG